MGADLSTLSTEELMQMKAGQPTPVDLSGISTEELMQMSGGQSAPRPRSRMEMLEELQPSTERPPKEEPSYLDKVKGRGETLLSLATGLTGGGVGFIGGTLGGIAGSIKTGEFGTEEGVRGAEEAAMDAAAKYTYAPRTKYGQEKTKEVGDFLSKYVVPVGPLAEAGTAANAATQAVKMTRPIVKPVAADVVAKAKNAAESARKFVFSDKEPEMSRSVGASESTGAAQRTATAESLPKPIKLTVGEATRQAEQLAFEKEQLRGALGEPLRARAEETNLSGLQNFEAMIELTGATAPDASATGNAVTRALLSGWKQAKAETSAAYTKANQSPEAILDVDPTPVLDYLNSRPEGLKSTALVDAAKKYAVILGIAKKDADGNLVSAGPNIYKMEQLYKEINKATVDSADFGESGIIKRLINEQTEPVAGPLYKNAKKIRGTQSHKYENRAVVARLLNKKGKGMDDPQVAASEVFKRAILDSSPEEITFLKRVIQTSNRDTGPQAWRELQGAAVKWIRDEATKSLRTDSNGNEMISPARLHAVIGQLDKNGRMDIIFGRKAATIMRDLDEVIGYVNTVPPGTLINNSGTATALIAAMVEAGAYGSTIGLPLPIISALKALSSHVKSNKIKAKIESALAGVN